MKSPTLRFHFMDSKESFQAPPLCGAVRLSSIRLQFDFAGELVVLITQVAFR